MDTSEAGRKGGSNSRKNLPPEETKRLAVKAAQARWGRRRKKTRLPETVTPLPH